ncbi:MAG: carboxypeptidase-like regulatory domain-containing protein, partial [Fidelibacterota bacterium]
MNLKYKILNLYDIFCGNLQKIFSPQFLLLILIPVSIGAAAQPDLPLWVKHQKKSGDEDKNTKRQSGTITGQVVDIITQQPLPGVNVVIESTILGAATDSSGTFRIENIPPGSYHLRFTMIGYEPFTKLNVA